MEITLTTPALLFPAVTFLLVAYTNRFLAINARIRALYEKYQMRSDEVVLLQIATLRKRVALIRNMQACGVGGLFFCVLCMLVLFAGWVLVGKVMFVISLSLLLVSLSLSLIEIYLSVDAINLELHDFEKNLRGASDTSSTT